MSFFVLGSENTHCHFLNIYWLHRSAGFSVRWACVKMNIIGVILDTVCHMSFNLASWHSVIAPLYIVV